MSLIKSIADLRGSVCAATGVAPNRLRLGHGLIGILRNELGIPDGEPLRDLMGMRIEPLPPIMVDTALIDHDAPTDT